MKIEAYVMVYNEERLLPYIIRHYSRFAELVFIDNNSTDRTPEIIKDFRTLNYHLPDEINDLNHLHVKETCWKGSKADWVIVVDADEFIYHTDIVAELGKSQATVIHPRFYNMYSEAFPTTKGQIYDEVNMGTDGGIWLSKMNIFRPDRITRMDWAPGCHYSFPKGEVIIDDKSEIKTLHMKFLGREYVMERHKLFASRLSQTNDQMKWGQHYRWTQEYINDIFVNAKLSKIL